MKLFNYVFTILTSLLFCNSLHAQNSAEIYASDIYGVQKGETVVLPIKMRNNFEVTGVSFRLYLPEGVSIAKNSHVTISEDRDPNEEFSKNITNTTDGAKQISAVSPNGIPFVGEDGTIFNVTLTVSDSAKEGVNEIKVSHISFTDANAVSAQQADFSFKMNIEKDEEPVIEKEAELYASDITGAKKGEIVTMPIKMRNNFGVTGVAFVLDMPQGVTIANSSDVTISKNRDANGNFSLAVTNTSNGGKKIVAASKNAVPFTGEDGTIINVNLTIGEDATEGLSQIKVSQISISDSNAVAVTQTAFTVKMNVEKEEEPVVENKAEIYTADISGAKKGETVVLPIKMRNNFDVTGVSFRLYLPEGVSIAKNSHVTISEDRDPNEEFSKNITNTSDGAKQISAVSPNGIPFVGEDGTIFNVTLTVSDAAKEGVNEIKVSHISFTDANAVSAQQADFSFKMNIKKDEEPVIEKEAELYASDITGAKKGETVTMPIKMRNNFGVTGVAFVLDMPQGVTIANSSDVTISKDRDANGNFSLAVKDSPEGGKLIGALSQDAIPFFGEDGTIMYITMTVNDDAIDGINEIKLSYIFFTDADTTTIQQEDFIVKMNIETPEPVIENKAEIYTADISGAKKGETVVLPIKMRNNFDVTGVSFRLYLPEGVSIAKNSHVTISEDRDPNEEFSKNITNTTDGAKQISAVSPNGIPFVGEDGTIFNVTLTVSNSAKEGVNEIKVSHISFTDANAVSAQQADFSFKMNIENPEVDFVEGDSDGDGVVDVHDVTLAIRKALGKDVPNFQFEAADMDNDGIIDVHDVTLIIKRALNK